MPKKLKGTTNDTNGLPRRLAIKNPPALQETQETQVVSGSGRLLEVEMATHSSILAWRIPWTEEPDGL